MTVLLVRTSCALCAVLLSALWLSGCESKTEEPAGEGTAQVVTPKPAANPTKDMVSAVSSATGPAPVDLKFELLGRPIVGQPLEIRLALIPSRELQNVLARFQGTEALELVDGAEIAQVSQPAVGVPLAHRVTVVPRQPGVSFLSAVVIADSSSESLARQFSIPVIAGTEVAGNGPASGEAATTNTAAGEEKKSATP